MFRPGLIVASLVLAVRVSAAGGVLVGDAGLGLGLDDAAPSTAVGPRLSGVGCVELSGGAGWASGADAYLVRVRAAYAPVPEPSSAIRHAAFGFSVVHAAVVPVVNLPVIVEAGAGVGMFARQGREPLGGGLDINGGLGIPLRADHSLVLDLRFTSTAVLSDNVIADVIGFGGEHHFATFVLGIEWWSGPLHPVAAPGPGR